jgi:Glyoxalase superfamily protein
VSLGTTTPILRIFDEAKAKEFSKDYKYARPGIEAMPWGTRDMSVTDPFGNRLTFTTRISA